MLFSPGDGSYCGNLKFAMLIIKVCQLDVSLPLRRRSSGAYSSTLHTDALIDATRCPKPPDGFCPPLKPAPRFHTSKACDISRHIFPKNDGRRGKGVPRAC